MPFGSKKVLVKQPSTILEPDELSTLHPVGIWPMLSSMAESLGGEALAAVATAPKRPDATRAAAMVMVARVRFARYV
jgi:hypothetical protein